MAGASVNVLRGKDAEMTSKITGDLEALMDDTFIVGSPYECVEQSARYRDLGFNQVSIRLFYPETPQKDVMDHIEMVSKDVVPVVHKL